MKCGSPNLNVLAATQSKFLCPSLRNRVLNEFSFSTVRVHMRAGYKYRLIYHIILTQRYKSQGTFVALKEDSQANLDDMGVLRT